MNRTSPWQHKESNILFPAVASIMALMVLAIWTVPADAGRLGFGSKRQGYVNRVPSIGTIHKKPGPPPPPQAGPGDPTQQAIEEALTNQNTNELSVDQLHKLFMMLNIQNPSTGKAGKYAGKESYKGSGYVGGKPYRAIRPGRNWRMNTLRRGK